MELHLSSLWLAALVPNLLSVFSISKLNLAAVVAERAGRARVS